MGAGTQNPPGSITASGSSGSEYLHGLCLPSPQSSEVDKLERLLLTPQSKKWFLSSAMPTLELGLDCNLSFEEFSKLPVVERFLAEMWNSSTKEIPAVEWRGRAEWLKDPLVDYKCPLDFFLLFWLVDMLRTVVQMTNLYAMAVQDDYSTRGGHRWYRLTIAELLLFFGILMLMVLKKLLSVHLHWSRKHTDLFQSPVIRSAMSWNRFEDVLKYIHLVDNKKVCVDKSDPNYSKIAKTAWLIDDHNKLYSKFWNPEKNLCIDEMMVRYTGKYAPIQQYLKEKPMQYGLKIWCLANNCSKYVQKIDIYCGAIESKQEGLGGRGHIITCDNFFTSLDLFWQLLEDGIYAIDTCRTNGKG
jgi:hypothetical protein